MKKQAKAQLKHLRVAPRKVRLLIDLIRGMRVAEAQTQLELSKKHASRAVLKLLNSAIANAVHNFDMLPETLVVKEAFVDGGPILYRWQPRAMGRATPLRKRSSHITIVLEGDAPEQEKKTVKKTDAKKKPASAEETAGEKGKAEKPAAKKAPAKKKTAAKKKTTKKKTTTTKKKKAETK